MKIARKVLSILLSIAMILSSIAVVTVSSFAGDIKYNASMSLSAVEMEYKWTYKTPITKSTVAMTELGDEQSGTIEVEPDQFYAVRYHVNADYFIQSAEALVFAPVEILNFRDTFNPSKKITDDMCLNMFRVNTDNLWVANECIDSANVASFNRSYYLTHTANAESNFAAATNGYMTYVAGEDGALGASKIDGDDTLYGSTYIFASAALAGYTVKLDKDNSWLVEFPVHIPADAAAGTEYKVFIPEGAIMSASNTAGKVKATINVNPNPDDPDTGLYYDEESDVWFDLDTSGKAIEYDAAQKIDLSGATLTFVVPGGEEELNWDDLQAAYDTASALDSEDYTVSSWNDSGIEDAIADAEEALDEKSLTDQGDIDALETALTDAMDALDERAIVSGLENALSDADEIDENNYVKDDNWTAFQKAVSDGNDIMLEADDISATNQQIVDDAVQAIRDAIDELTPLGADYKSYDEAVEAANEALIHDTWYTEETYGALEEVMGEYGNLDRDLPITEQDTVDEATGAITTAYNALQEVEAKEYDDLLDVIAGYNSDIELGNLVAEDYTEDSWDAFIGAIDTATKFYTGTNYTQKQQDTYGYVTDEMSALNSAYGDLVPQAADLTDLYNAYTAASALTLENYEDGDAKDNFVEKLGVAEGYLAAEPEDGYPGSYQTIFDNATDDLTNAQAALTLKKADYTKVNEAMLEADALDKTLYTEASLDVLAKAILAVKEDLTIDKQDEVNAMAKAINDAITDLQYKDADYTALDAEIDTSNAITDSTDYTEASWATFAKALEDAKAVPRNLKITDQKTVDDAKDTLESARTGLVGVGDADYSKLNAAIAEADKKVQTNYTTASWFTFSNAKAAAKAIEPGLNASHQNEINAAADNLTNAMNNLVLLPAKTEALEAAVEAAKAKIENAYKYESVSQLEILLSFIKTDFSYTILEQDTVDEFTTELNTAMDSLVWAKYVPTNEQDTKYSEMTSDISMGLSDYYTTATWDDAKEKYDAINPDWTYENEAAAGRAWDEFESAFDNLAAAEEANYDAVDKQIGFADGLNSEDYTAESWAVLEDALVAVERGLNENHQAEVDKMASDIADAIAALVPYADYSLLKDIIADADEIKASDDYKSNYYTDATKAVFDKAYADAVAIPEKLTEKDQATIDNAVNALDTAMQALTLKGADYTVLDDAIQTAAGYEQELYTPATWSVLANAVVAAKNVNRKLTIKEQTTVDGLTYDIHQAITDLELKPVSDETDVTDVQTTPTVYGEAATYDLTITGRAIKVQFVDKDGKTWTFDRNGNDLQIHDDFNIVSYNSEGEVVSSDAIRQIAYEVWTVKANLPEGEYKVVAKYSGTGWETDDAKNYSLTVVNKIDDCEYIGSEYATSGPAGRVTVEITTQANVQKVQLAMNGTTNTSTTFVTNPDGTKTFTATAYTVKGENNISINIKSNNKWYNEVDTITYTAE